MDCRVAGGALLVEFVAEGAPPVVELVVEGIPSVVFLAEGAPPEVEVWALEGGVQAAGLPLQFVGGVHPYGSLVLFWMGMPHNSLRFCT